MNLLIGLLVLGLIAAAVIFISIKGTNLVVEGEEHGYTNSIKIGLGALGILTFILGVVIFGLETGIQKEEQKKKHQEFFEDQEEFLKEHGYQYGGHDRRIINYPIDEE